MTEPGLALGVAIRLPPEAIVPLAIAILAILILVFAGNALISWRERNPRAAWLFGYAVAAIAAAAAVYLAAGVVPPTRANDPVHEGVPLVSLFDPILSAFCAAVAGVMWRFAGQKWIGCLVAVGIAAALIAKPFVRPLFSTYDGVPSTFSPTSETHLFFLLSGVALGVVALVLVAMRARSPAIPSAEIVLR